MEVESKMGFATDVPQPASPIEPTSTSNKVKLEPSSSLNFGDEHKRDVSSRGSASKVIEFQILLKHVVRSS